MSKIKYPKELEIKFSGFLWTIQFIDVESENYGLTFSDKKVVQIFTRNKSDQNILETLLHEICHVALFDMAAAVFNHEAEDVDKKEENLIRLASPRLFDIVRSNPEFIDWYIKAIKKLEV